MPKKKAVVRRVKKVPKKVAKSARPKTTKKVAKRSKGTEAPRQKAVKKSAAKPVMAKEPAKPDSALGRPLVTQEEKLYMLFHDDYQCRQVFEFLRVETVKELEHFTPQQIVHLMSRPIRLTVDRIRQRLAQFKRALKDDEQFAADFRSAPATRPGK